jgi:hypothetical protein
MEVDSDGNRIGTAVRVEVGHPKVLRIDQSRATRTNSLAPDLIPSVDDHVRLGRSWDELRRLWHDEFAKRHGLKPHI